MTGTATVRSASTFTGTVRIGGEYTKGGTSATNTDTGVLSVNGAAMIEGASTLSCTVAIGGGYTNSGNGETITDAEFSA